MNSTPSASSHGRAARLASLIGLLALTLLLGLLWTDDYGMGADEHANADVGRATLRAFTSSDGLTHYLSLNNLGHHGPSYFMVFAGIGDVLPRIVPGWLASDGRHLSNFLTFLLAGAGLYFLLLRLLPRGVALAGTAFFLSQPLLFGHGFVNQKDTPFMTFFLLTVVVGLAGADRLADAWAPGGAPTRGESGLRAAAKKDLGGRGWGWQLAFAVWLVAFVWLLLDLLHFGQMLEQAKSVVSLAHANQAWEPINRLYESIAEDAHKTGVAVYHAKVEFGYYLVGRIGLSAFGLLVGVLLGRRALPRTLRAIWPGPLRAYGFLLGAAGLLGFTVSIRPLGGLAGVLVSLYLIHRLRWRSGGPLMVFWTVAGLATYLTWPWLWPAPIERLIESAQYLADFDDQKLVLFRGQRFPSEAMPWDYLPLLLTIQVTEPIIPLAVVGLAAALLDLRRRPERRVVLLLLIAWFAVVAILYMLPGSVHYNNFRHVLFILPPLFVFFGYGLAALLRIVKPRWLRVTVLVLLLLPGILGLARLHPYEYTYYNAYVGGTSGANGKYHIDYWCLSLRDAQEYVNRVASPDAVVYVRRSIYSAIDFARPDLQLTKLDAERGGAEYVLVCTHYTEDALTSGADRVYTVTIGPNVAAEVWKVRAAP